MGKLIPNTRRRVSTEVNGKIQAGMENVAVVTGGTVLRVNEGSEEGSKIDGSEYATAHIQYEPGRTLLVSGYGAQKRQQILDLKEGDQIDAFLHPQVAQSRRANRNGYQLAELVKVHPAAVAPASESQPGA